MALEISIEDHLVKEVEKRGGMALKGAVPGTRFIDRICILPGGVTLYAETKRPKGGRLTKHQEVTLERLRTMRHVAHRFDTKEEIDLYFRAYDVFHHAN